MLNTFELKVTINVFDTSIITIDFENKVFSYAGDKQIIKKDISYEKISLLLNAYLPYWNNEYINNSIIDGKEVYITLQTNKETIKYTFKNNFPNNYNQFKELLNEMVGLNNGK